jgi:hypothetical protein
MTAIVTGPDGRAYLFTRLPDRPVFVADMPRVTSAAGQPHTGHATLLAQLDPVQPGSEPLAKVRLPTGRLIDVLACHIHEPGALAARRILPAAEAGQRALA